MATISHIFGQDISASPTGDIAVVDGTIATQQRVIRRLLTNPGDDESNLNYGAGLRRYVGQTQLLDNISAVITAQIALEESVAQTPIPVITVTGDSGSGIVIASVQYADSDTGVTSIVDLPLGS